MDGTFGSVGSPSPSKQPLSFRSVPFKRQLGFLENNTKVLNAYYDNLSQIANYEGKNAEKIEGISKLQLFPDGAENTCTYSETFSPSSKEPYSTVVSSFF